MESRESTKLEYLKQPHITAIAILLVVILCGAIFTATRRVNNTNRLANMETVEACKNFVDDETLCKFAASNEVNSSKPQVMTITETSDTSTAITVIELESATKNKSTSHENGVEVDASIVIEDSSYVKDYQDSVWAHYKDPNYQATDNLVKYDFTTETSTDVAEFRNNYHAEGKEACGELTCYKYRIDDNQSTQTAEGTNDQTTQATTYLWFDDQDFILRRITVTDSSSTVNTLFEYKEVKIEAPTPTKEINLEDIQEYLD